VVVQDAVIRRMGVVMAATAAVTDKTPAATAAEVPVVSEEAVLLHLDLRYSRASV